MCSVVGKDVTNNSINLAIIKSVRYLDKVRQIAKDRYGIEFEEYATLFSDGWLKYANITDNRDIALIVERVNYL